MTAKEMTDPASDTVNRSIQRADVVALLGSLVIVITYLLFQTRSDSPDNGLTFIYDAKSWNYPFSALTLVAGVVGIVSALVCIVRLNERAARWWFAGLGLMGLAFPLDNMLGGSPPLALGGWLATLGCLLLIVQAALPRPGASSAYGAQDALLGLVRVGVGTLWFTQLLWKLPWNNFGCAAGPLVPGGSSGICYWIGQEIAQPRWTLYKGFLEGIVAPNMGWILYPIIMIEVVAAVSLMFGLFTRLGALAGALQALNLFVGLSAIRGEWDWTYLMLALLCAVFISAGGRFIGLDVLLAARFKMMAERGSRPARLLERLI